MLMMFMPKRTIEMPETRGQLEIDASMAKLTWFRTGGPAEWLFRPADLLDLQDFLADMPSEVDASVVGVGSNLIVRDRGIDGVVIRLGKPFAKIEVGGSHVIAGAGAMDVTVAARARDAGLGGLEFLRGVPGTIGGALRMNAGAYGREIADVLVEATAVDRGGRLHHLRLAQMGFSYRSTKVPKDWIFVSATFRAEPADQSEIQARMDEIAAEREASQPLRTRTGGSTFKNPPGQKAWELIDQSGCRGLTRGDAIVSEKHCNFLINQGNASAADIEGLGEEVRKRVKLKTGVDLEWEIRRIGRR